MTLVCVLKFESSSWNVHGKQSFNRIPQFGRCWFSTQFKIFILLLKNV